MKGSTIYLCIRPRAMKDSRANCSRNDITNYTKVPNAVCLHESARSLLLKAFLIKTLDIFLIVF